MPIEFRCGQCGKLLRTGDDTAGRQAQCPECGALTQIPTPVEPISTVPPIATLGPEGEAIRPDVAYQAPGGQAYFFSPAQRVSGPATALIVTAIIGMVIQGLGILFNLVKIVAGAGAAVAFQGPEELAFLASPELAVGSGVVGLAISSLVLLGAMKMKNLTSYSLAMTSAILAMIPCISPCCILGLPFGIWALVVLSDGSVKAAFRR